MPGHSRVFLCLCSLLFVCCLSVSTARADCNDLLRQFDAVFSSRSLSQVTDMEAKIAKDGTCRESEIQRARLSRATLQFDLVKELLQKGAPQSDYEPLLLAASELIWQAAVFIGNTKTKQRDYVGATVAYERAIELVKNPSITSVSPGEKAIRGILNSAAEARSLAADEETRPGRATFVAAAKDHRDGSVGGTMSESIRDIKMNVVPVPIGFETASAKFTEIGQKYADELLLALQQQHPLQITLVGHTDERGADDYNMRLSDERVKALATYLKQRGVTAKITTIAKGKTDPYQPTDPSQFTKEEIWALNRRVEWKRQ